MKKKLIVKRALIFLFIFVVSLEAQSEEKINNVDNLNIRNVFLSIGSGFPEVLTARLGAQLNANWSLSGKASVYYSQLGGTMNFGIGIIGIRVTNYFAEKIFLFNNISLDAGYLGQAGDKNLAADLSIGNESILKTIKTYWSIGFSIVQEASSEHVYLLPGIKLGINLNL